MMTLRWCPVWLGLRSSRLLRPAALRLEIVRCGAFGGSTMSGLPMRAGEIGHAEQGSMKRDAHLHAPDAEQQRTCEAGRHESPIAFSHLLKHVKPASPCMWLV